MCYETNVIYIDNYDILYTMHLYCFDKTRNSTRSAGRERTIDNLLCLVVNILCGKDPSIIHQVVLQMYYMVLLIIE